MAAPRLTASERERIVAFEVGHLGMGERPPGSNNTEPGKFFGTNGMAWCAAFQSWSFYSVLGRSPFPASTSKGFAACVSGANWFRRQGAWATANVKPERGWLIFFTWPGDSIEHHIGLVLDSAGPRNVNTIEGNTSDKVQFHHRAASISGYGIINYVTPMPPPGPKPAPIPMLTHTVHPGEHGAMVVHIQDLLRWYGVRYHYANTNPGPSDGDFGPKTSAAVIAFKKHMYDTQRAFKQKLTFTTPFNPTVGVITYNALTFWAHV